MTTIRTYYYLLLATVLFATLLSACQHDAADALKGMKCRLRTDPPADREKIEFEVEVISCQRADGTAIRLYSEPTFSEPLRELP